MAKKVETALIVDDSDPNVVFWDIILKERNIANIITARSGSEALQHLREQKIDFLVVSWNLSSTPGYVLIQKIRCNKKWRTKPLIVYSAKPSPEDFQLIREIGIENFVQQPFNRDEMCTLVQNCIKFEENKPTPELLCRKMESLLTENKTAEAKALLDPNLLKPGAYQKRAKILEAEIQLQSGERDLAEKTLKAACELDPNYFAAKYALARLYSQTGKIDDALQMLTALQKATPKNFITILHLSSAYIDGNQYEAARQTLHKITALDPENREVDDELGKIALKEGNLALAAKFLSETQNGDEIARFYNSMGISLVSKGMFDKGIETYNSAIQVLSSKAKMYLVTYNLGLALRKKGDLTASFKAFCDSYLADPSFEKAYNAIAKTAQELKKGGVAVNQDMVRIVKEKRAAYQEALAQKHKAHEKAHELKKGA